MKRHKLKNDCNSEKNEDLPRDRELFENRNNILEQKFGQGYWDYF